MQLRNRTILLIHVLLWALFLVPLCFSSLIAYESSPELIEKIIPGVTYSNILNEALVNLGSLIVTFYLFYFVVFKWLFIEKLSVKNVLLSILLVAAVFWVEGYLLNWVGEGYYSDYKGASVVTISRVILLVFRLGLALGLRGLIKFFSEKDRRRTTEVLHQKSQADLFRSKVNPHFLFNTLNSIDTLIHSNPNLASEVLIKLSEQMRYMVYDSDVESILLEKELQFVRDYIFLEKLRMSNPESVEFEIVGEIKPILLPSMLFIAYIENAFKHKTEDPDASATKIRIVLDGDWLRLSVRNQYDLSRPSDSDRQGGMGQSLAKKRLEHFFPDRHELNITKDDLIYQVDLSIKMT